MPVKKDILVVEDDDDIREAVAEILEDAGYHAARAANGQAALSLLRHAPRPCLILLDLMMPVMDGWQFRAELLNDPALALVPVVVVSADPAATSVPRTAAVLPKPINLDTLLSTVERCCA